MKRPPKGWTTAVKYVSNYDGDSVKWKLEKEIDSRLLFAWCKEIKGTTGKDKELAIAARDFVMNKLKNAKSIEIFIPQEHNGDISDLFTFGRVLLYCWVDDEELSLNEQLVANGLATKTKAG